MPFKSGKQRRYLYKNEPEVAKEFAGKKAMSMPKSHLKMTKKQHEDIMNGYAKSKR